MLQEQTLEKKREENKQQGKRADSYFTREDFIWRIRGHLMALAVKGTSFAILLSENYDEYFHLNFGKKLVAIG